MTDLFQPEETAQLSPRLKWMQEHHVRVIDGGSHIQPGEQDDITGLSLFRFCATDGHALTSRCGLGDTEDEAIADFAKKNNVRLWNEQ